MNEPTLRILSLGAGVQSTTLLLLSASGELPKLDAAIFSDTGWEPQAVYDHLDRLEKEIAIPAGIPICRVAKGNLRDDLLNPDKMAMIPAFTLGGEYEVTVIDESRPCTAEGCHWRAREDEFLNLGDPDDYYDSTGTTDQEDNRERALEEFGKKWDSISSCDACGNTGHIILRSHIEKRRDKGMLGRKCTQNYKLNPIRKQTRLLLGALVSDPQPCRYCNASGERVAPWRTRRGENIVGICSVCNGSGEIIRVGQPPSGAWAETWIGFSTDEIERVSTNADTRYSRSRHPLLELNMSRVQCEAYLRQHGWGSVAKSACLGCPYHGNRHWREMRDQRPAEWAQALQFDQDYRRGAGMNSERFLHIACKPLNQAPIDRIQRNEYVQVDIFDLAYEERAELGDPDGCSPYGCRSGPSAEPPEAGAA